MAEVMDTDDEEGYEGGEGDEADAAARALQGANVDLQDGEEAGGLVELVVLGWLVGGWVDGCVVNGLKGVGCCIDGVMSGADLRQNRSDRRSSSHS